MTPRSRADVLQALHERHAAELGRFVLRLTRDPQVAEDIVQETMLRAWRDSQLTDRPEAQSRAWLFTVARHLVVDRWRSAASRHEVVVAAEPDDLVGSGSASMTQGDRTEQVLDRWLVTGALAALTPQHRAVIAAAYYEGRSVAEIAAELKIPEGTVKSRLHYAIRSLRLTLSEKGVTRA